MSDESSQPSKIETEQLLREMTDEWAKALVSGDGGVLSRIMAEDFFFAYPFEGDDKEQFIDDVTSGEVKIMHVYSLRNEAWHLVSVQACPIS
jgi:hypothetical protein